MTLPDLGTLTARDMPAIEADIAVAKVAVDNAKAHLSSLYDEQRRAQVAEGQARPHVWAGKMVKRTIEQRGSRGRRQVVQQGTITLNENGSAYPPYRGHMPRVGEWFVLSPSGKSAYSLRDNVAGVVKPWELV
jgi:hypothetical protein